MLWPEIDDWGRNARRGSKQAWRAGAFEPQKRCRKLEERNISRSLPWAHFESPLAIRICARRSAWVTRSGP